MSNAFFDDDQPPTRIPKRAQYEQFAFSLLAGDALVRNKSHADPADHEYRVEITDGEPTHCECPADEHNAGPCKHRTAVAIRSRIGTVAEDVQAVIDATPDPEDPLRTYRNPKTRRPRIPRGRTELTASRLTTKPTLVQPTVSVRRSTPASTSPVGPAIVRDSRTRPSTTRNSHGPQGVLSPPRGLRGYLPRSSTDGNQRHLRDWLRRVRQLALGVRVGVSSRRICDDGSDPQGPDGRHGLALGVVSEFDHVFEALQSEGFVVVDEPTASFEGVGKTVELQHEDRGFQIDLFERQVVGRVWITDRMHDRAEEFWSGDHATAFVLADEDMFLQKAVSGGVLAGGRHRDIEDMRTYAQRGLEYETIRTEIDEQRPFNTGSTEAQHIRDRSHPLFSIEMAVSSMAGLPDSFTNRIETSATEFEVESTWELSMTEYQMLGQFEARFSRP